MFEIFCRVMRCAIEMHELVLFFAFSITSMLPFFDPIALGWIRHPYPTRNSNYHSCQKYHKANTVQRHTDPTIACGNLKDKLLYFTEIEVYPYFKLILIGYI